jgi:osmotically inducible protein OsmC
VAGQAGANVNGTEVSATVGLGTAEQLVAPAHQVCPYSNATRGNVDVKLSIV